MKKNQKLIWALAALICAAAVLLCVWKFTRPETQAGTKNIAVTVVHSDGGEKKFNYQTEAEYLADALTAEGLISGDEGEFGLFILTVDGETVDYDQNQSWWCLTKDGEQTVTGVSEVVISDGDHYELTYTIG